MTCYLVRHGDAKPAAQDPRRPLSDLGQRQVERVAAAAAARGVKVAEVWHSDKIRAQQTADIMARFLGNPAITCEVQGLAPEDDPVIAQVELQSAPDRIMLVGHLPHLSRLVSLLVARDPDRQRIEVPTAAMICLGGESENWKIEWSLTPDEA
ncbi:MAG: phosphohistidine phosphatase SixA [Candidatus Binatia bacterium]